MALSKELADELTCPIDLEILVDPVLLKCLHNICQKDVDQLMDIDDLIKCPVCKRVSKLKDIKRDFKTQKLIELHQSHQNLFKGKQICEWCEDEPAVGRCRECEMYIGERCKKGHTKATATKNHTIFIISDNEASNMAKLRSVLAKMEVAIQKFDNVKTRKVESQRKRESVLKNSLSLIEESEKCMILEVKKIHKKLRQDVEKKQSEQEKVFDSLIKALNHNREAFSEDLQAIKDTVSQSDQNTIANDNLITDIVTQSEQSHGRLSNLTKSIEDRCDQEFTAKLLNREETIKQLQIMEVNFSGESSDCFVQVNLSNYVSRKVDMAEMFRYEDTEPQKITTVGSKIWLVRRDGCIEILDNSNTDPVCKQKSISIRESGNAANVEDGVVYMVCAVAQAANGRVIAACGGAIYEHRAKPHRDIGLIAVSDDGVIDQIIAEGMYRDVACDNQYVYGLKNNTVTIHQHGRKGWLTTKEIQLQTNYFQFCIHGNILTLSNFFHDLVDQYDMGSDTNETVSGGFSAPLVACNDVGGNVLICDAGNDRLQVCMSDGTCHVLTLTKKLSNPRHATVDHHGQLLIVTRDALFKLI